MMAFATAAQGVPQGKPEQLAAGVSCFEAFGQLLGLLARSRSRRCSRSSIQAPDITRRCSEAAAPRFQNHAAVAAEVRQKRGTRRRVLPIAEAALPWAALCTASTVCDTRILLLRCWCAIFVFALLAMIRRS